MSEELKALVHRVVEKGWNKGNLDVVEEIFAADVVHHRPPMPDVEGIEAYKQFNVGGYRREYTK